MLPEGLVMPDGSQDPTEKEDEQDGALIELLIALANRRDPVSPGRSRVSRLVHRDDEAPNDTSPHPSRGRAP
jgi:hypothetical protein